MKRPVKLILALAIISVLAFYVVRLFNNEGKSDTELIDFSIEKIETVDKFSITDVFGRNFTVVKGEDGIWTDENGGCVTQESVEYILETFEKIEFKGYLPDSSLTHYTKLMSAQHTKVEIYQNGEWSKTWYIGPAAQDHYGQIMLLDDSEYGKSDQPVLMKIKGHHGIIEPRFFADPNKWKCTNIFKLPASKIEKVDVKFFEEPKRSFTVTKKGTSMNVYQEGKLLQGVDTAMIFRYLNNYQKIHFEMPNYVLNEQQVDSVKLSQPFCILTVKENNGHTTKLRMFRIKAKSVTQEGIIEFNDNDHNRFWCELPDGNLVKCQYFVFNPLILGHVYFPLDISMYETADGIPN